MRAHLRKGLICLAKSKPCIYEVSKSGVMLLAEDGSPRRESPWVVRAHRLAQRLDALRKELAMTPAARARAPTPGRPPKKGEERLFDD